jgi:hypothetical protein
MLRSFEIVVLAGELELERGGRIEIENGRASDLRNAAIGRQSMPSGFILMRSPNFRV